MITKLTFLKSAKDVAIFLGTDYKTLTKILYKRLEYNYNSFSLKKKSGGVRTIDSPSKELSRIQTILKETFEEFYIPKPSTFAFTQKKNIVKNAQQHLDKSYIFNIDLEDFFGTIHFGRVKRLLQSKPFNLNHTVSTIFAQICCYKGRLPQGAPTSPIMSNMICRKLDSQLQKLAGDNHCTYTRYADDITFSFNCSRSKLPSQVVAFATDGTVLPGGSLLKLIESNGFLINSKKTRLSSKSSRMEVTGLTVNEFPNVQRKYMKQISAMLHAWEKWGYSNAEEHHIKLYRSKERASDIPPSFKNIVMGKLLFLSQVRGENDAIYKRLATKYNSLVGPNGNTLKVSNILPPNLLAIRSLWVIESERNSLFEAQGSGFQLKNVGIITSAHVVGDINTKELYPEITCYKPMEKNNFKLIVERICWHSDIAICQIQPNSLSITPSDSVEISQKDKNQGDDVIIMGFPKYAPNHGHSTFHAKISKIFPQNGVNLIEVGITLRVGNSGGPLLNNAYEVIGVVAKHSNGEDGRDDCVDINEIQRILNNDKYLLKQ